MTEEQTLNTEGSPSESETLNAGESSTPMETDDGLMSTAEFVDKPVEEQEETSAEETPEGESEGEPEDDKGPIPYQRFKEKVDQVNELSEKLKEFEAKLEAPKEEPKEQKTGDPQLNFKPMHLMKDEDLQDWFDKSPLQFISNLAAQVIHEAKVDILGEIDNRNRQSTYQEKLNEFSQKNDGFDQLLNSGKIEDFVRKNPGHDVFSAYYEMTADKRQQSEEERIKAAVNEALENQKKEFQKNAKAKRELRTISGGGSQAPQSGDVELKDTSAQGGLTAALAARLAARRKKAG